MAKKPKAPSGLGISRNGNNFTFSWSIPAKYTKQELYYRKNKKGKTTMSVGAGTKSKVATINLNDYYPKKSAKLTNVQFFVKGYKSKWSDWSNKPLDIKVPPKPILEASHSDDYENRTTFTWGINWGNSSRTASNQVFRNYKWWTSLLPNSELDSDKVTDWQESGVTNDDVDSSSKTIDETEVFRDNYSYTRYFKIVARGPAGDSQPSYAKHVYAFPNPAQNVSAVATRLESGQGYRVSVEWTAEESKSRPIDSISVEYAIETPNSSVSTVDGVVKTTLSVPTINSWTAAGTLKDTSDKNGDVDGATFSINGDIAIDKCIFVRVVTKHDNKTTPSEVVFVKDGYGELTAPTALSASISNNVATVTVTNGSDLTASFVGIYYRTDTDPTPRLLGVKPAGSSAAVSVQLPSISEGTEVSLGARTFLADYSPAIPAQTGITEYAISDPIMASSGIVWDARPVPSPPIITLASPRTGVVRVTWDWVWTDANGVELSWANHDDAWESTDGPQTYILENTRASAWNVAGLDVGTWYFRVRLFKIDGEATTYGTYSNVESIKIASTPPTPVLTVSPEIISPDGKVTCYWAFSATDGDDQSNAEIREVILDSSGSPTNYIDIGVRADNEQYKTVDISQLDWQAGTTHYLAVKVITLSGEESDNWSLPKPVKILQPITCTISSTSLETVTVVDDEDESITHTQLSLTEMPLSVSATGAGEGGQITYILERAEDYHLDRPDESETTGFGGETIALIQKSAENIEGAAATYDVDINFSDLIGPLDDNAKYNLVAIAQDSYGQTGEATIPFEVHWTHKAVEPSALVEIDRDEMVAFITPEQPDSGYLSGDSCDIYRLSTDRPELIVQDAVFGTKYVDLYPALGNMGGHRIVYKTASGSYITDDREFAWTDYDSESGDKLDIFATIIDFSEDQIVLPYDLSLSSKWNKDFTMTKYLGGSVEGDWNPAVERTGTVKTRVAVQYDPDLITSMRRLANYAGICHVRTPDGSSFAANINVSEDREEKKINMIATFSLEITKVDSEGFDGIPYNEWIVTQ